MNPSSEIAALRRELKRLQLEVAALQARVYADRPLYLSEEDKQVHEAIVEQLKKERAEREQKERETPVKVSSEEWESGWMTQ